jgi:hypothetical protein
VDKTPQGEISVCGVRSINAYPIKLLFSRAIAEAYIVGDDIDRIPHNPFGIGMPLAAEPTRHAGKKSFLQIPCTKFRRLPVYGNAYEIRAIFFRMDIVNGQYKIADAPIVADLLQIGILYGSKDSGAYSAKQWL